MVAVTTPPAAPVRKPDHGRLAIWVALSLLLAVGIPWFAFTSLYSPFGHGSVAAPGENVAWVTDGLTNTTVIVTGPAGTIGVMGFGLSNDGPVPIRIEGPVVESLEFGVRPLRDARWSQHVDANRQPVAFGYDPRPFPTTLEPGEEIAVWISVRKYDCNGGTQWLDRVPLRWSVLGRPRQSDWMLDEDLNITAPIAYCFPDEALKHIAR